MKLQDGGTRKVYETGAQKENNIDIEGKGAYNLIPQHPLRKLAEIYRLGAQKYSAWNWTRGIKLSSLLDSAERHLSQFHEGMEDEDHLHQCIWNLFAISWTLEQIKRGILPEELNDLPSDGVDGIDIEIRSGHTCNRWRKPGKGFKNG